MHMKYPTLVLLLGALALTLRGGSRPAGDTDFDFGSASAIFSQALAGAARVEIYEGLPGEPKAFDREKQANSCRQITDQWFYSVPQEMRHKHVQRLQRLVDGGIFLRGREGKPGGAFHADFAVVLTYPKNTVYALFCFDRREARIIREGNPFAADPSMADFQVTADLDSKSFEETRSVLTGYRDLERASTPSGG